MSGPQEAPQTNSASGGPVAPSVALASLRHVAFGLAIALATLAPPVARVYWEGHAELDAAAQAAATGDVEARIVHLGRAARWYLPVFSHDEEALLGLIAIGDAALVPGVVPAQRADSAQETSGSDGLEVALRAFREARAAILSTRTWTVAHPQTLLELNQRIARLMEQQEVRLGVDMSGIGQRYELHLSLLESVPAQRSRGTWVAAAACLAWLGALVGLGAQTFGRDGHFMPRRTLFWGVLAALAMGAWMVLMRHPEVLDGQL